MFSGKKKKLLSDSDFCYPVGKRFEAFRRLLCLTRHQLAAKLDVSFKTIEEIENGETLPDLCLLNYLCKEYGLNINWLIYGQGDVILIRLSKAYEELKTKKQKTISIKTRETIDQWKLMKLPDVENIIFGKMEEAKILFKDQIEALKLCQGNE